MHSTVSRFAIAALASLAMATSANAAAILQFEQQNPNLTPIVATALGSTTAIATTGTGATGAIPPGWIPVFVTLLNAPIAQPAFMSFTAPLTSGSTATQTGTAINQDGYTGTIQFNFVAAPVAASNILTATFTGGLLSGVAGGNSATFSASQPPSTVTFTSAIPEIAAAIAATTNRNFAIGFSGLTPGLTITGGTVASFTASAAGTFSTAAIPEPSSIVMASMSVLAGLGYFGFRRRLMGA
jgi:hypothetical protein